MTRLDDLTANASLRGVLPSSLVTVVSVKWFGSEAVELTYKDATGKVANVLLYGSCTPARSRLSAHDVFAHFGGHYHLPLAPVW